MGATKWYDHKFVIFLIFCTIVCLKATLIPLFPSPWIFSDEQSYFGMAGKIVSGEFSEIFNSHMPGYSLILSVAYSFSSVWIIHKVMMVMNIIMSSSVFILSYMLFRNLFLIKGTHSIVYAILISFIPSLYLYNYTIMSENLFNPLVYLMIVLLFYSLKFPDKKLVWIILGLVVGFLPIVRAQGIFILYIYSIFIFIQIIPKFRFMNNINAFISLGISGLTYVIFKYVIFGNTGSYDDTTPLYIEYLSKSLSDLNSFKLLLRILTGEIVYLAAALLFIPVFIIMILKSKSDNKRIYYIVTSFILILCIIYTGVSVIHVNYVSNELNEFLLYGRYIDFLLPILFTFGLAGIHYTVDHYKLSKNFIVVYISIGIISVLCFQIDSDVKFPNIFSSYLFFELGTYLTMIILVFTSVFILIAVHYRHIWIVLLIFAVFIMANNYTTLVRQNIFSEATFDNYTQLGKWFDDNKKRNEEIIVDKDMQDNPLFQDTSEVRFDYIHNYSLFFWAGYYNAITVEFPDFLKEQYIVSDRLIPRTIIDTTGPNILYDKTPLTKITLSPHNISRFASGFLAPDVEWIWMTEASVFDRVYFPNNVDVTIEITLYGLWPKDLNKEVEVFVNNYSIGKVIQKENIFIFKLNKEDYRNIHSIEIKSNTFDPNTAGYAIDNKGLGLDIKDINFTFD